MTRIVISYVVLLAAICALLVTVYNFGWIAGHGECMRQVLQ